MTINYHKSEASSYPELLDKTSSQTSVYLRKNVVEVEREDTEGNKYTVYQYDEAILTKEEYAFYAIEQATGDANTEAQLAIAELAEQQEMDKTELEAAIAELAEIIVG